MHVLDTADSLYGYPKNRVSVLDVSAENRLAVNSPILSWEAAWAKANTARENMLAERSTAVFAQANTDILSVIQLLK